MIWNTKTTLSISGGGGDFAPEVFLNNSKTPQDNEMTFCHFFHTSAMSIALKCCHGSLLFPVCYIIFGMENEES